MTKQDLIKKAKEYGFKDITASHNKERVSLYRTPDYLVLQDEGGGKHRFPTKNHVINYFK